MRPISLLLFVVALAGCASIGSSYRLDKFEATSRAYERAIRWSDFRSAFALAGKTDGPLPDLERLQSIRVTSYEVIDTPQITEEASRVAQAVEIHYVNQRNMSERLWADQQVWVYTEKDERWRLQSAFPVFQ